MKLTESVAQGHEYPLMIRQLTWEADQILSAVLVAPDGGPLPAWTAGSHIDVLVGAAGVRQYSLCGDPADTASWRIAVLRERDGRGGSEWIHERLRCGERIVARGPRNHFHLEPADSYCFIAGGIGITPLIPMIRQAIATDSQWELHYGGRRRSSMAFVDELLELGGDRVRLYPENEFGRLPLAEILDEPRSRGIYCCGPTGLLDACLEKTESWPDDVVHVERFVSRRSPKHPGDRAFTVTLAQTGSRLKVGADQTILEVMAEEGLAAISSCEQGLCGTCETRVLAGAIDHRDEVLSKADHVRGDRMMICVSRAAEDHLEIDA